MSVMHAKAKLDEYCNKKYDEYVCIIIISCVEETDIMNSFKDIFENKTNDTNSLMDILKNKKK